MEISNEKPGSEEESGSHKKRKKRDANDDSESPMDDSDLQQVQFNSKFVSNIVNNNNNIFH